MRSGSSSPTGSNEVLASSDVDGVVITHGTDTMEETAYFLDLVVKSDKPVVLVGSMRPATAISADGPMNLYNAMAIAADPRAKGRGVLVTLNDQIHAAREVDQDQHLERGDVRQPESRTCGAGEYREDHVVRGPGGRRGAKSEFSIKDVTTLPRVDIIYAHANMSTDLIDAAVANGAKGLVIAGVGDGNMTGKALERLRRRGQERRGHRAQLAAAERTHVPQQRESMTTSMGSSRPSSSIRRSHASCCSRRCSRPRT